MENILIMQMIAVAFVSGLIGEYRRSAFDVITLTFHQFSSNVIAGALLSVLLGLLIYHLFKSEILAIVSTGLLSYQNTDNLENFSKNILDKIINKIKGK
jgi:hypothetical protein